MLNLNLTAVSRGEERIQREIPRDHPIWNGTNLRPLRPLRVDLTARMVGAGVLVRGTLDTALEIPCRRCLESVEWKLDEEIDLLFEPLSEEDDEELEGEVYSLPAQGTELDLIDPIREQVLLSVPEFLVCNEACRGLCPQCGTDLNRAECGCVPEPVAGAWDALKKIKFD